MPGGLGEVGLSDAPQDQEVFHLYDANVAAVLADSARYRTILNHG